MRILSIRLFLAILLLVSPSLFAVPATTVSVENAEVRQPILGRSVTAGYLTLRNNSEQAVSLVAVTSDSFQQVELHQHSHVNGVMRMQQVAAISIKANSEVSLTPGGLHLMLFEPKNPLTVGDSVTLQLQFSNQQVLDVKVPIVALPKR
jgi:periplasmic copper chaperone A